MLPWKIPTQRHTSEMRQKVDNNDSDDEEEYDDMKEKDDILLEKINAY